MTTLRIVLVCILTVESCLGRGNQSDEGYSGDAQDDQVKALKERMDTLWYRIQAQRKDFESIVAATNGTIREKCGVVNGTFRSYPCTKTESNTLGCLNRGFCYVLLTEPRKPTCHCARPYGGKRCEEISVHILMSILRDLLHKDLPHTDYITVKTTCPFETVPEWVHTEPRDTGSTYVHWGKGSCPDAETEMVYKGWAGGSDWYHDGGAADYLCLPRNPKYDTIIPGRQFTGGIVYGAEYETTAPLTSTFQNYNVPCSVCRTNRSSVLMIPGTDECPSGGWRREYKGWLSSGRWNHRSATEFVCLTEYPDVVPGTNRDDNGKLFYLVEGACGSLPCGKSSYHEGFELKCVVCSK